MRTNLRNRSGARPKPRPVAPLHEAVAPEPVEPAEPAAPRPNAGGWPEDWSDPSKLPQMSAIWPLLWLTVPFVLAIVYELVKFR